MSKLRKGYALITTLFLICFIAMISLSINVHRLNLTSGLKTTGMQDSVNYSINKMCTEVEDKLDISFKNMTYAKKYETHFIDATVTAVDNETATPNGIQYALRKENIKLNIVKDSSDNVTSLELQYPVINDNFVASAVFTEDALSQYHIDNSDISYSLINKSFDSGITGTNPRIYTSNILEDSNSYKVSSEFLSNALFLDLVMENQKYKINYPIVDKPVEEYTGGLKTRITKIPIPKVYKDIFIVFCNRDTGIPTGYMSSNYKGGLNPTTGDVRDSIRKDYSYIRIHKDTFEDVVDYILDYNLPTFERNLPASSKFESGVPYTVTNIMGNVEQEHFKSSSTDTFPLLPLTRVSGTPTLTSEYRSRQYYTADTLPKSFEYSFWKPNTRDYVLKFNVHDNRNNLVKTQTVTRRLNRGD